ncbi:RHS repeat-associated core domain-containing protein [Pseudomonas sp. 3JA]|uniref:RHS repeat-associated core domain-containing protein n=1 Tax=Pseudomonas sp. 3JA TaxID=3109347 RepID=UPI003008F6DE
MSANRETLLCRYHYDPLDRLANCSPSTQTNTQRFYLQKRLTCELQGSIGRSIFQQADQLLAQQQRQNGAVETTLLTTDQQRSVLHALNATQPYALAYTPYGHRPPENGLLSLLGFNGERPDPETGHYLMGNGYRAFNPVLMRFNSPDSLSPFGEGGLNAYVYCGGDPVNRSDPTGHFPLPKLLKIFQKGGLGSAKKSYDSGASVTNNSLNNPKVLKNRRSNTLDYESQLSGWAIKDKKAFIIEVNDKADLKTLKNNNYKYKFIFTDEHEFFIGGIKKGEPTKILSHPVIASQAKSKTIISAGYIMRIAKKTIITDKSGHFQPEFSNLAPVQAYLQGLGKNVTSIRNGSAIGTAITLFS